MRDGFTSERTSVTVTFNNGVSQLPVNTNSFTPSGGRRRPQAKTLSWRRQEMAPTAQPTPGW